MTHQPSTATPSGAVDDGLADPPSTPVVSAASTDERARIEQQLEQLKRKEAELRRALLVADHPELADPIREVDGRVYAVRLASDRIDSPLTKTEQKTQARLEKQLSSLRSKREELDLRIAELEGELSALTDERLAGLEAERAAALRKLFATMAEHAETFEAAGLKVVTLVPDLEPWLPALRAIADEHADRSSPASA